MSGLRSVTYFVASEPSAKRQARLVGKNPGVQFAMGALTSALKTGDSTMIQQEKEALGEALKPLIADSGVSLSAVVDLLEEKCRSNLRKSAREK